MEDNKKLVDQMIDLMQYKIALAKATDNAELKAYYIGQVDGIMLVAMKLADIGQAMALSELDSKLGYDIG